MSELNGTNFNFNPVGKNIQPKMVDSAKPVSEMPSNEQEQISDISTNHAEIIGRSMLANDTLKNDLDAILDNPTIADNSDKLFEFAYDKALKDGATNPYEEAASFSTTQL